MRHLGRQEKMPGKRGKKKWIFIAILFLLVIGMIRCGHKDSGNKTVTKAQTVESNKETKQEEPDRKDTEQTDEPDGEETKEYDTKVSTITVNEHKSEDYFAEYQAPADDEYDYKWANDHYYGQIGHLRKVLDAGGYEVAFGYPKPSYDQLCEAIDQNPGIGDKYAPYFKEYIQRWLTLYPETDFSNFLYNLKTLEVNECTKDEIKWAAISADALACYRQMDNAIYINKDIDLSSRSNDDYIILGHELWHAARNGRHTIGGDNVSVSFYEGIRFGLYEDEALDTYFMYEIQGENKRSVFYTLSSNYFRIIMDGIKDTYTGSDYMNHSINYLAEKMDQYMEGTEYAGKALYTLSLIDGEMDLHYDTDTEVTLEDLKSLFGYMATMYCRKYLKEGMSAKEAEQVFEDFMFEITWHFEGLRNPYEEITPEAFRPFFEQCCENLGIG